MGFGICKNSINDEYPQALPTTELNLQRSRGTKNLNNNSELSNNYRSASVHNLVPFIKLKKIIPEEIKLATVTRIRLDKLSVAIEYPVSKKRPPRKITF